MKVKITKLSEFRPRDVTSSGINFSHLHGVSGNAVFWSGATNLTLSQDILDLMGGMEVERSIEAVVGPLGIPTFAINWASRVVEDIEANTGDECAQTAAWINHLVVTGAKVVQNT